jgi:hypothetical protein
MDSPWREHPWFPLPEEVTVMLGPRAPLCHMPEDHLRTTLLYATAFATARVLTQYWSGARKKDVLNDSRRREDMPSWTPDMPKTFIWDDARGMYVVQQSLGIITGIGDFIGDIYATS